ncbi:MAG TPA: helical backbone metal receptor [Pyrinomonadaceae bacterium]|nr:helical backbone metal receptor [Pyrinomonadaceae bacterium]
MKLNNRRINKVSPLLSLSFLLVAFMAAACVNTEPAEPGNGLRSFHDDLGREVFLPAEVTRAVSLAPSVTEMVFAAGAGDRLVGVTTYCNFPKETEPIRKIGDTQTPNIESIVALKPQIVLVSTASQLEAFMNLLEQQRIAVLVMDPRSIDDVPRHLVQLGRIFGTEETAETRATTFAGRVSYIRHQVRYDRSSPENGYIRKPVRVFVQISKEPLFTIGRESFLNDAIEIAGGISVTKDVPGGYPKLSKETAMALDPQVLILSDSEDNREPNAVFAKSPAVIDRRVYRINADILSRPGPRLVDALEEIASKLRSQDHGEPK